MFFDRIHSIVAVVATLAFTAMLTLPCFCASASAQMEESEERCPCTENEHDQEHEDCCCGCAAATPVDEGTDVLPSGGAVILSVDEDALETPSTWWSPDLVVTLWLVNRLAEFEAVAHPEDVEPPTLRPDLSDTYLRHSTFLI